MTVNREAEAIILHDYVSNDGPSLGVTLTRHEVLMLTCLSLGELERLKRAEPGRRKAIEDMGALYRKLFAVASEDMTRHYPPHIVAYLKKLLT